MSLGQTVQWVFWNGRIRRGKETRLKQFLVKLVLKWKLVILPAMLKLGFWGAAAAALLDSASIPIPMDILIAGWVWNDKGHFWLYCLMGGVGSAIGGLVPYGIGRAGGELFLLKARFDRLRDRFERQEFLAVMIPSMMPPPTPWKLFVFAAGVFEMRILPYMAAVCAGRIVRWLALSLLVLKLGPGAVGLVQHHALTVLLVVGVLAVIGFGWWWLRKRRSGGMLA